MVSLAPSLRCVVEPDDHEDDNSNCEECPTYNSRSDRFCPFLAPDFAAAATAAIAVAVVVVGGGITAPLTGFFTSPLIAAAADDDDALLVFVPGVVLLLRRTAICRPCPAP